MIFIIALLIIGSPVVLSAQPDIEWQSTFGERGHESATHVILTADGGFAASGYIQDIEGPANSDFYLVKFTSDGEEEWTARYNPGNNDQSQSLVQLEDEGYMLFGLSNPQLGSQWDAYIVRVDSIGEEIWSQAYGGDGYDEFKYALVNDEENILICGNTYTGDENSTDIWLMEVDEDGEIQMSETFGGEHIETVINMIELENGDYLLTGYTSSFGEGRSDGYIVRVGSDGEEKWSENYGDEGREEFKAATEMPDGNLLITGTLVNMDENRNHDIIICKIDDEGELIWWNEIDMGDTDEGKAVLYNGGRILIAGTTQSLDNRRDMYIMEVDSTGEFVRWRGYGGDGDDWCRSMKLLEDGSYLLWGITSSFGAGQDDAWVVKTERDDLHVADEDIPSPPNKFKPITAFPNPFNSSTTLSYNLPTEDVVTISIMDLKGGHIEQLLMGSMTPGRHSINWNASDYPSGIYFARLQSGSHSNFVKITLMK